MQANPLSTWVVSLTIGFLVAVLGTGTVGWLGERTVQWYRISSVEGRSGFHILFFRLIGAVTGLIVGVIGSRIAVEGPDPHFFLGLGFGAGGHTALVLLAAALARLKADQPPTHDQHPVHFEVQLRCPPGSPRPQTSNGFQRQVTILKGVGPSTAGSSPIRTGSERLVENHWTLEALVPLETRSREKTLLVSWEKDRSYYFPISSSAIPVLADFEWSDWIAPSQIYQKGKWESPDPEKSLALRFRVQALPESAP